MNNDPIKIITLDNGCVINIFNLTKKVADYETSAEQNALKVSANPDKDVWHVSIQVVMEIITDPAWFEGEGNFLTREMETIFKGPLVYKKTLERALVYGAQKDEVFEEIMDFFTDSILPYLKRPDFGKKLALKCYEEAKAAAKGQVSG